MKQSNIDAACFTRSASTLKTSFIGCLCRFGVLLLKATNCFLLSMFQFV